MTTRFQTRAFLICFIPFAVLLTGSFWIVQRVVESSVRSSLSASLRENQAAIADMQARTDLQNSRFLRVAGENAALKAGIQLLLSNPGNPQARSTVADQLRELGGQMGFDLFVVSAPGGAPLAGVMRQTSGNPQSQLVPLDTIHLDRVSEGMLMLGGRPFEVVSVAIDQADENLGSLAIGEYFSFSGLASPSVLLREGTIIASNYPDAASDRLSASLAACGSTECDLRIGGNAWISAPLQSWSGGYLLRSLVSVDAAMAPIQARLNRLFVTLALICTVIAFLSSLLSARSIVGPISAMVGHLRKAAGTGVLTPFESAPSSILEIRDLTHIYSDAAAAVSAYGEKLQRANLEFVGSLASALDARDPYTSGHSNRVSQLACATAAAMNLPAADIERIRIGALLHDIGKIGIADRILQKADRLTDEEWSIIKQHPVIGRRILEGVNGFAPYLAAVELHHENWNGTGYPHRQSGNLTPIDARIIHVADAYDAMTTDRSYRSAMSHDEAVSILRGNAGSQFDPRIVAVFLNLSPDIISGAGVQECCSNELALAVGD
ncbi:MAG TPA: HD-GYP domain-containing protein [Acidobacteriaceae bacterium]